MDYEKKGKKGNKDAWFSAYTSQYVGIVWMGYDNDVDSDGNAQYLHQIYGGKYPALLWKSVMQVAHRNIGSSSFSSSYSRSHCVSLMIGLSST